MKGSALTNQKNWQPSIWGSCRLSQKAFPFQIAMQASIVLQDFWNVERRETILTWRREKDYPFWGRRPSVAPYQASAMIPLCHLPNIATRRARHIYLIPHLRICGTEIGEVSVKSLEKDFANLVRRMRVASSFGKHCFQPNTWRVKVPMTLVHLQLRYSWCSVWTQQKNFLDYNC